jgi:hypothetical protein
MANNGATIDDLTMDFKDEDGTLLCKTLEKEVLTKGGWATLMFKYQDLDKNSGTFKAPKYTVRRFQKSGGEYKLKSKFVISSAAQAQKIADVLTQWAKDGAANDANESGSDAGDED